MPDLPSGLRRIAFHAPPLMWSEALSGLRQAVFRGDVPEETADAVLAQLEAMPIAVAPTDAVHRRAALEIARDLGWAKTYDAEYVALARSMSCSLLTTDRRLMRGAAQVVDVVQPADLI